MGSSRPRNSTRATKARSLRKSRRKPSPPKPSKLRAGPRPSRDATATPESVPVTALREICTYLKVILSSVVVVEHALLNQKAELDDDAARVLRVHVSDPLYGQSEAFSRLLGEDADEDGGAA